MAEALRNGEIDVAFGVLPASISDLTAADLMLEKLYFVAHRKFGLIPHGERERYCAQNPCLIQPETLNHLPFICPRVSNGLYGSYEKIMEQNHIQPSRTIAVSNLNTGFQLAMAGLGVQLLSGSILQMNEAQLAKNSDLDFCILEHMPVSRKCTAAYAPDNIKKELIEALIQIIREDLLSQCQFIIV